MSSLDSTSTLAQIKAAYYDNASYDEDSSTAKASAFATACRFLLLKLPKRMAHGGRGGDEVELDPVQIRLQLDAARQWVSANQVGGSVKHVSFANFRG